MNAHAQIQNFFTTKKIFQYCVEYNFSVKRLNQLNGFLFGGKSSDG